MRGVRKRAQGMDRADHAALDERIYRICRGDEALHAPDRLAHSLEWQKALRGHRAGRRIRHKRCGREPDGGKLVKMGLLERVEDPSDRRVRLLLLTSKGRLIVERNFEARQGWIKTFCSTISPELAYNATHIFRELITAAQHLEGAECLETQDHPWRDRGPLSRMHPRRI